MSSVKPSKQLLESSRRNTVTRMLKANNLASAGREKYSKSNSINIMMDNVYQYYCLTNS